MNKRCCDERGLARGPVETAENASKEITSSRTTTEIFFNYEKKENDISVTPCMLFLLFFCGFIPLVHNARNLGENNNFTQSREMYTTRVEMKFKSRGSSQSMHTQIFWAVSNETIKTINFQRTFDSDSRYIWVDGEVRPHYYNLTLQLNRIYWGGRNIIWWFMHMNWKQCNVTTKGKVFRTQKTKTKKRKNYRN